MTDKQTNALTQEINVSLNDLVPIYDTSDVSTEKLKKVPALALMIPRYPAEGGLQILAHQGICICVQDYGIDGIKARVSALDLIRAIHADNADTITYGISVNNLEFVESTDPTQAYIECNCTYLGVQNLFVRITNGVETSWIPTYCLYQDNNNLCF